MPFNLKNKFKTIANGLLTPIVIEKRCVRNEIEFKYFFLFIFGADKAKKSSNGGDDGDDGGDVYVEC